MNHLLRNQRFPFPPIIPLVEQINSKINAKHTNLLYFHDVVHELLQTFIESNHINLLEIFDWVSTGKIPMQPQFFGEIPITLFYSDNYVIDLYIWSGRDTDIHDHSFNGVFTVIEGEILQTEFEALDLYPYYDIYTCQLIPKNYKIIKPGKVVRIRAGQSFIHKTTHLSSLTITLCVRTCTGFTQQYGYCSKGIIKKYDHNTGIGLVSMLLPIINNRNSNKFYILMNQVIEQKRFSFLVDIILCHLHLTGISSRILEIIDAALLEHNFKEILKRQILTTETKLLLEKSIPAKREQKIICDLFESSTTKQSFIVSLHEFLEPQLMKKVQIHFKKIFNFYSTTAT